MAKENTKRKQARTLFITGEYTQKQIAELMQVSENTVGTWKKEDGWEDYSLSLLTTRENELKRLYLILRNLNDKTIEDINAGLRVNPKDGDAVIKYTAAIKSLELETSIAEKVEIGIAFINFIRQADVDVSKLVTKWFDLYLKSCFK